MTRFMLGVILPIPILALLVPLAAAPAAAQERADLATAALAAGPTGSPMGLAAGPGEPTDAGLGGRFAMSALGSGLGLVLGGGAAQSACGDNLECSLLVALPVAALASTAGSVLGVHTAGWVQGEYVNTGATWLGAGLGVLAGSLVSAGLGSATHADWLVVTGYIVVQGALAAMTSIQ